MNQKWLKRFGAEYVYNKYCKHLIKGEEYRCKVKMDMMFCGNNCIYATNVNGSNVVDSRGKVVGVKNECI